MSLVKYVDVVCVSMLAQSGFECRQTLALDFET